MATVNAEWLERKINELNHSLQMPGAENESGYSLNKRDRDYYVQKLIELEENGLTQIKV